MEPNNILITLPSREDMLARLIAANNTPHFKERLYPHLLEHAGRELLAGGVVLVVELAINAYTENMPSFMAGLIKRQNDMFIDALVLDPVAAEETKRYSKQVNEAAKAAKE